MTILAQAFKDAGYTLPEDRLSEIARAIANSQQSEWAKAEPERDQDRQTRRLITVAREALQATKTWDGAKDEFYKRVRNDAELLWTLFQPYRSQAAQMVLAQASRELRELEVAARSQPSAGGRVSFEDQKNCAPRASAQRQAAPIPSIDQQRVAMGARAAVVRLSMLDTFKVNGQPIGDLTSEEAGKWAGARERDARFVRMLTANLPPDQPIRKFRTGDDAAAIYAQAQESADA